MHYKFRRDQRSCLAALRKTKAAGKKRALVVKASGLGKTVVSGKFIADWLPTQKKPTLIVSDKEVSFEQFRTTLENILGYNGFSWGTYRKPAEDLNRVQVLFGSFQILSKEKHLKNFSRRQFGLMVVDECHHSKAPTYRRVTKHFKPDFLLGLTATPDRMDGEDIREFFGEEVFELGLADALARDGLLAKVDYRILSDQLKNLDKVESEFGRLSLRQLNRRFFIPERDEEIAKRIYSAVRKEKNPRILVFCPSIDYTRQIASELSKYPLVTKVLHSKLSKKEQKRRLQDFRSGNIQVLCTVDQLNEALDVPEVSTIVFLRSTQSYNIFVQQLGRGLRLLFGQKGKVVKVLDFVCSFERIKMIADIRAGILANKGSVDSFDVSMQGNWNFEEAAQKVCEIFASANWYWRKEATLAAVKRACFHDGDPIKLPLFSRKWTIFKKKYPYLRLCSWATIFRNKSYLELNGITFEPTQRAARRLSSSDVLSQVRRACNLKGDPLGLPLYETAWKNFKKKHPNLALCCWASVAKNQHNLKAHGITFKKLRRILTAAEILAQVRKAGGRKRHPLKLPLYSKGWNDFRNKHRSLKLCSWKTVEGKKALLEQHGIPFEKQKDYYISASTALTQVKEACCRKDSPLAMPLYDKAWRDFKSKNVDLKLCSWPSIAKHKVFLEKNGITFEKQHEYNIPASEVLKCVRRALHNSTAQFELPLYRVGWIRFREKYPDLGLCSWWPIARHQVFLEENGIIFVKKRQNVTRNEVLAQIQAANNPGENSLDLPLSVTSWAVFRNKHPELKFCSWGTIKKHKAYLKKKGVKFK